MRPFRRLLTGVALLGWPAAAAPADVLQVLSSGLDRPTLHVLGLQVLIAGDDDHDAAIAVRYRAACEPAWRDGPPLFLRSGLPWPASSRCCAPRHPTCSASRARRSIRTEES